MKKENLLFVEQCFRNIQLEKDVKKNIRLIENAIKREYNIPLEISIIDNKQNQFFGMCVYPHEEEVIAMTELLLRNASVKEVEKLHAQNMTKIPKIVEIDSMILYDSNLNATAGEITAILLHELGHVATTDTVVHKFKKARAHVLSKSDRAVREILKDKPFIVKRIFMFPILQIFSNRFNAELMDEKHADNFAVKEGYGEELFNVLNKFIVNGKGSMIKRTEAEDDKDIEITVEWAITNIKELEYRRDRLKRSLKVLALTTPSNYIKKMINNCKDDMFTDVNRNGGARRELVGEAFILSNMKKVKAPSGSMDRSGRVKKLDARDLDIYRAELERVATTDDKIFLLERLYDLLDHAEYALYLCQEDPRRVMQSETTIKNYIESVNELIKLVNAKKISRVKYGLYIKYPSEYEG